MAVGRKSPDAMSVRLPVGSIRITLPVPGVGNWFPTPVVFSSTYSRPAESKARPRIVVRLLRKTLIWPVGVSGINYGDINEAANLTCRRRDAVDLLMIWLDGEEIIADRDHTVPGSVGFKIGRIGISDRMIHEEPAKVGAKTPTAVGKNAYHAIRDVRHTMRAASSAEHGIKLVSDERDISH